MKSTINLSRLMRISWVIQRNKHNTRSKALIAAWAILTNEDVTVLYLTRKLNRDKPVPQRAVNQMSIFKL